MFKEGSLTAWRRNTFTFMSPCFSFVSCFPSVSAFFTFLLNILLFVPFLHFFASSGDLVSVRFSGNQGGLKKGGDTSLLGSSQDRTLSFEPRVYLPTVPG